MAAPVTGKTSEERVLGIVKEIKREKKEIQAVGACFNPKSEKFDITVVSNQPNEMREQIKEMVRSSLLPSYHLEVRHIGGEGRDVTQSGEFHKCYEKEGYSEDIRIIQGIISKHVDSLFRDHPNLTSISVSPVKSTGYGTPNHVIKKQSCIVIFVDVKFDNKRIPLGSKRIPEIIDGIKTDVREGIVESMMHMQTGPPTIGPGFLISIDQNCGTVGPLVYNKETKKTGFLTSLHVLLSLENIARMTHGRNENAFAVFNKPVLNEPHKETIGTNVNFYFNTGNKDFESGYEVALVELADGVKNTYEKFQSERTKNFLGEIGQVTQENKNILLEKVGGKTGLTEGKYHALYWLRFNHNGTVRVYLSRQLELLSAHHETDCTGSYTYGKFAEKGDSGSFVTRKEGKTDKAIGIFTGLTSQNTYIVTPIQPILDRIKKDGWKICHQGNQSNETEPMQTGD